jgi:hypothetical protein
MDKYEEALVMKEFEIGIIKDAIVQAIGGKK